MELWEQPKIIHQSYLILSSFHHWLGYPLLNTDGHVQKMAQQLFEAPFPVLSHDTQPDPIYNYGNRKVLELWELDWAQLTTMPSRHSAEPLEQTERVRLLEETMKQGYCRNAHGIRISSTGKRYEISDFIVWNLLDESHQFCGQAATFSKWVIVT